MKNNKLFLSIARVISTIFVPPTFIVFVFSYFSFLIEDDSYNRLIIISTSIIFGLVLPVYVFIRMRKTNSITDIDATQKEERNTPYLLNSFFCIFSIPPLLILEIDHFFIVLWALYFINTLFLYFINKKWKISVHLIGATIPLGALHFIEDTYFYIFLIVILVISWARIRLDVHNLLQVIAGAILGFSTTYFGLYIFYYYIFI